jgi:DNA-binding SARP family transcriptional activator
VRFKVLGPLTVAAGCTEVPIRSGKQRAVLAVLLSEPNKPVTADRLIAAIWPVRPPKTAVNSLQVTIHHLRTLLGDPDRLRLGPAGYTLLVRPGELDVEEFEELLARGRTELAAGAARSAGERLREALSLWHGPAYEQLFDDLELRAEAERLESLRLTAVEARIDADLADGLTAALVGELRQLVRQYPARERFIGQLMIALDQGGRRAEAIETYHAGRAALARELGIAPGAELQRTFQALLDPAPAAPTRLPADLPDFFGRRNEIGELLGSPAAVTTISGPFGVGKSALAVRVAHRLRDAYPDGQLYADLRGANPSSVLAVFLTALGASCPEELAERAALYRSLLADRRVLVLLDNAVDEAQVEPLLPGTASCRVLITSRPRLVGLPAQRLDLEPFPDGLALLGSLAGERRIASDRTAAAEIVDLCDGCALAVRVAGSSIADHPDLPLSTFAAALADPKRRLELLSPGGAGVRAALDVTAVGLPASVRTVFPLLAALPTPDLTDTQVAAALNTSIGTVRDILDHLVDVRLMTVDDDHRYRFPPLIRLYAR